MNYRRINHLFRRSFILPVIVLFAAVVFLELAGDVWLNEGFRWDVPLMLAIHRYSQPWLDQFFITITQTASTWIALPLVVVGTFFWRRENQFKTITLLGSTAGLAIINWLLKLIFARPRPAVFPPLTIETSYSFPSGHTMVATAFYGLLAVFLWRERRYGWAVLAGVWPLLVGLSRVYLGVHYPSDVLGALAVGIMWVVLVVAVFDEIKSRGAD